MKQTAVDWLLNEIKAKYWCYLPQSMKQDIIDQALEMEKEQIIESYDAGLYDTTFCEKVHAEQYYTETYESNT